MSSVFEQMNVILLNFPSYFSCRLKDSPSNVFAALSSTARFIGATIHKPVPEAQRVSFYFVPFWFFWGKGGKDLAMIRYS